MDWTPHHVSQHAAIDDSLPFRSVPVWHKFKWWHTDALEREGEFVQELPDSIVARPGYRDTQGRKVGGQFSTALVNEFGEGEHIGVEGTLSYFFLTFPHHLLLLARGPLAACAAIRAFLWGAGKRHLLFISVLSLCAIAYI